MNLYIKFVHRLAKWAEVLAYVAVAVMMIIAVLNCITRRLGAPIAATYDYVCFLLVLVIAPGLARCETEKGHIFLDMFTNMMPKGAQNILGIIINLLCAAFCGVSTWALVGRTIRNIETGLTGMSTPIPVWPFILIECLAMLLLTLVFIGNIFESINKLRGREMT